MYDLISSLLYPFIYIIKHYFNFLLSINGSEGISIIFTSLSISILLIPLLKIAKNKEDRINLRISEIDKEVREIPLIYKGEERFRIIERLYDDNNFHPIENIFKGLSLFVILPILLSAYLFFIENIDIFDIIFFSINLSEPDNLIFGINVLPILIFCINFLDSRFRYAQITSGKNLYLFLSFSICLLIYSMPSCMTLYWATSSIFSLLFNMRLSKAKA
jgi:membrane protein insertase Oxa1/YidC/SpoIIIJ